MTGLLEQPSWTTEASVLICTTTGTSLMKKTRAQRAVVKGVHGSERNRFASQRAFLLLTSSLLPFSLLFSARLGSALFSALFKHSHAFAMTAKTSPLDSFTISL